MKTRDVAEWNEEQFQRKYEVGAQKVALAHKILDFFGIPHNAVTANVYLEPGKWPLVTVTYHDEPVRAVGDEIPSVTKQYRLIELPGAADQPPVIP